MKRSFAAYRQLKKLNFLVIKLNMIRQTPASLEKDQVYEQKLVERFGG